MNEVIEEYIEEFTKLLIKQDFEDKKLGQVKMIKQVEMYRGIIKLLKMMQKERFKNRYYYLNNWLFTSIGYVTFS